MKVVHKKYHFVRILISPHSTSRRAFSSDVSAGAEREIRILTMGQQEPREPFCTFLMWPFECTGIKAIIYEHLSLCVNWFCTLLLAIPQHSSVDLLLVLSHVSSFSTISIFSPLSLCFSSPLFGVRNGRFATSTVRWQCHRWEKFWRTLLNQ